MTLARRGAGCEEDTFWSEGGRCWSLLLFAGATASWGATVFEVAATLVSCSWTFGTTV